MEVAGVGGEGGKKGVEGGAGYGWGGDVKREKEGRRG